MAVFVLDQYQKPLMPLEPREALTFNPQRDWFKALANDTAPLFNVAMATDTQQPE